MDQNSREGLIAGLSAYLVWGFLPVYFVTVAAAEPAEVLALRIIWAIPVGALILTVRKQWPDVKRALTHKPTFGWLTVTSLFIAVNWLIYIWAIQEGRIVETSLGYYINPLIHMLAGVVLLGERLGRVQVAAVVLATIGVAVLTIRGGQVPWVALSVAVTFAVYAVVRKRVDIGAMPGLFVETLLLLPFALAWFLWITSQGQSDFAQGDTALTFWLIMSGPITAIPLMCFAIAARKLRLTTIGFLQFVAPTIQFCTGIYYGEELTVPHIICFGFIWLAVAVFSFDAIRVGRTPRKVKDSYSRRRDRRRTAPRSSNREYVRCSSSRIR